MTTAIAPVLVVDDNHELLELIEMLLLNSGYPAIAVQSSAQALELARKQRFSALFTDLVMPGLNGHELIKAVRDTEDNRELPVVIMSGLAMSEQVIDQPGIYHLEKPFSLADFNKALERALVWQAVH
jgi:CheY-like chemotaxis protein